MENTSHTTSQKFRQLSRRIHKIAREISYLERRKAENLTGVPLGGPRQI